MHITSLQEKEILETITSDQRVIEGQFPFYYEEARAHQWVYELKRMMNEN